MSCPTTSETSSLEKKVAERVQTVRNVMCSSIGACLGKNYAASTSQPLATLAGMEMFWAGG